MKRLYLLILLHVFACSRILAGSLYSPYEYLNNGGIVYKCHVGTYEATVVNIYRAPETLKIPSHIIYDNEIYTVTAIDYEYPNEYNYGYYTQCDFEYYRANIHFIEIPNTVNKIGGDAFVGMRRLQKLTIPEDVELHSGCFSSNVRLESLTILGEPRKYYDIIGGRSVSPTNANYLTLLRKYLGAPEGVKIFYPALEEQRAEQITKYRLRVKECNTRLQKATALYNQKWRAYPYNRGPLSDSIMPSIISSEPQGWDNTEDFNKAYNGLLEIESKIKNVQLPRKLKEKQNAAYHKYWKNPEAFITDYVKEHPEVGTLLDSLVHEYRCLSSRDSIFTYVIEQKKIPKSWEPCRQSQYRTYAYLYASQEEFNQWYDRGEDALMIDIEQRETLWQLSVFMRETGKKINLQKESVETRGLQKRYLSKLQNTPYYNSALRSLLINTRFAKEWKKNGSYFSSLEDFYTAYVSPDYRQILRQQKTKAQSNN